MSQARQLSFLESSTSSLQQISNSFVFSTNSTERLRITATGGIAFGGSSNFGSAGQVLQSNGNAAPTWVNVSGLSSGQVNTVAQTGNASYFPTFVNSNNASSTGELVYTTSSFAINPSTGNVGIGTNSPIWKLHVQTASSGTDGIYVASAVGGNAFFRPNSSTGANNSIVLQGDAGIIYSSSGGVNTGGFVIAPWATSTSGIRLDSSGNLGIGTSTPSNAGTAYKFVTTAASTGSYYQAYGGFSTDARFFGEYGYGGAGMFSNHPFLLFTNSIERLRITSTGGMAFGGASNFGSAGQVLQSNGNASPTWVNTVSNAINLSTNRTNWATNGTITAVVGQLAWKNYGNNHTIFDASQGTSPSGSAVNNTNAAVAWIGTYPTLMGWNGSSTYGVRVDSARVADSAGSSSGSSAQVNTIAQTGNAVYFPTFVDSNNSSAAAESVFTTSSFTINPSTREVIINAAIIQGGTPAGGGNNLVLRGGTGASSEGPQITMGYGNNTTSAITGQANRTWNIDIASGAANNNFRIFRVNSVGGAAVALEFTESNGGTQLLSLGIGTAPSGTTGEIRATNEVTAYYSDRRLKENIKPIDNAVEKVSKLNGITYTPNDLAKSFGYISNRTIVGLFADEVDVVLPEAVRPAPFDQDEAGNSKSGENYQTIQYEKLVPLLVEAIKEQQQQINQLIKTVAALSNK